MLIKSVYPQKFSEKELCITLSRQKTYIAKFNYIKLTVNQTWQIN